VDFFESPSLTSYVYQLDVGRTFKYSIIGTDDQSYKLTGEFKWVMESRLRLFIGTLTVIGVRSLIFISDHPSRKDFRAPAIIDSSE
jgi:hypothetical protein